jgi:RimJ/RimL family protein N-acetyltransferase
VKIKGKQVIIQPTSRADLNDLLRLWNDGQVMQWVGFPDGLGYDREQINSWFSRVKSDPDRHHFVFRTREIAFCGEVYYALDHKLERASLDIKLLPEAQGRGLATDALKTLINHVFEFEKSVNYVWTEPSKANLNARRLYVRCGLQSTERPPDIQPGESFWVLSRQEWKIAKNLGGSSSRA